MRRRRPIIAVRSPFGAALWEDLDPREPGRGNVTLRWVVSKTYQHTAEHTRDVLRIVLFWGMAEAYNRRQQEGDTGAS